MPGGKPGKGRGKGKSNASNHWNQWTAERQESNAQTSSGKQEPSAAASSDQDSLKSEELKAKLAARSRESATQDGGTDAAREQQLRDMLLESMTRKVVQDGAAAGSSSAGSTAVGGPGVFLSPRGGSPQDQTATAPAMSLPQGGASPASPLAATDSVDLTDDTPQKSEAKLNASRSAATAPWKAAPQKRASGIGTGQSAGSTELQDKMRARLERFESGSASAGATPARPPLPPLAGTVPERPQLARASSATAAAQPAQQPLDGQLAADTLERSQTAPAGVTSTPAPSSASNAQVPPATAECPPRGGESAPGATKPARTAAIDSQASANSAQAQPRSQTAAGAVPPRLAKALAKALAREPPRKKPRLASGQVEQWDSECKILVQWLTEKMPRVMAQPTTAKYSDDQMDALEKHLKRLLQAPL